MRDDVFVKEHNARQLWHPMGHPGDMQANAPTIIESAEGSSITDIDGHTVVDAVGGLWCANLGYSNEKVKQAIADQLAKLPYYSAFAGTTNPPAIEAAHAVTEFFAEDGMVRAFFTSGGSDSVETALRLARQYHRLRGEPTRTKFLSLKKGYHGTHFGGASVNGNNRFRTAYEPLLAGCHHLPSPYPYRNPFHESDPAKLAHLIAQTAEDEIAFQGASTIAAFIMEPIQGAGGVIVPDASFMGLMRDICDRHGSLMIADEVSTGFGRSGDWSGSRHWGVAPDMMCTAKGITSAYFPVGACLASAKVAEPFESDQSGEGGIYHGYTYSGHPAACAAGLASLAIYREEGLFDRAQEMAPYFAEAVHSLGDHPMVKDVRSIGMMAGVEIHQHPEHGSLGVRAQTEMFWKGLHIKFTGNNGIVAPMFISEKSHIDEIVTKFRATLDALPH